MLFSKLREAKEFEPCVEGSRRPSPKWHGAEIEVLISAP